MTWPITLSQLFLSGFLRLASLFFQSFDEAIELRICFSSISFLPFDSRIIICPRHFLLGVLNYILGAINCNKYSDAPLEHSRTKSQLDSYGEIQNN